MGTTEAAPADTTRYLRIAEVLKRIPVSRPTIYRLAQKGEFPKPVKVGSSSLWIEQEVIAWERARSADR